MTDVPPDNGASGLPPAVPSEPPVVRRSTYSEPPPGTEPPTFDDDALAEAMAAEVATYTSPVTLPKLPPVAPAAVPAPGPAVPPAPASAVPPAPAPAVHEPATTWDGRPLAEEAAVPAAPAASAAPVAPAASAPAPVPDPVNVAQASAVGDDSEPSEEELRRALGGASTLETIERLETELKHISNGEPTILPVTATPAAGVTLGVPASAPAAEAPAAPPAFAPPAPSAFAPPAPSAFAPPPSAFAPPPSAYAPPAPVAPPLPSGDQEPEPGDPAPSEQTPVASEPAPTGVGTSWPFPPPGEPEPEPALDHPAPGHFFPAAFEPIDPDAAPEPSFSNAAPAEPAPTEPAPAEPSAAEPAFAAPAAPVADAPPPEPEDRAVPEPVQSEPTAPPEPTAPAEPTAPPQPTLAPEQTAPPAPTAAPLGDAWPFPTPDQPSSVDPLEGVPAPDSDPLAWLAPPAGSTFPPPPEAAGFAFGPPADEAPVSAPLTASEIVEPEPEPDAEPAATLSAESTAPESTAPESAAPTVAPTQPAPVAPEPAAPEFVAPQPATPSPFAPEPPNPSSYAPYPFEVDPSLIDPVAAATVAGPAAEPVAVPPAIVAPVELAAAPEPTLPPPDAAAPGTPWWEVAEPTDGVWEIPTPDAAAPDAGALAPAPDVPMPYSTEPPVGPEAPDWLSAPPPVFTPPDLVEPPVFVDSPPNAALDPVSPITANTMASLPMPLPTDQPNIADRAELPPPPGYEDIPIMSRDVTEPPEPVAPSAFFPPPTPVAVVPPTAVPIPESSADAATDVAASVAAPLEIVPPAPTPPIADSSSMIEAPPTATEPSRLDDEDDDVIDDVDRVAGLGAIPIASAGTIEPPAPPSEPIATSRLADDEPAIVDEQPKQPPALEVEEVGPEPTPLDMRAGRAARLFWLWFAANSSVLSMGLGAVLLGTGMSLRQSIVATLAGVAISFLPLGLGTLAGKWSGQPTMIVSRAAFGHVGNILPALLAVLTRVLWGGVLLWLLATAVAQVLVGAGLDAGLGTSVWQLAGLVAGFVIATVIAVFGYGFVAKLQLVVSIVSGLLILGAAALTFQRLDFAKALTVPDGNWILVVAGAALVFSVVGLAWVHSSSDLARYQRPGSSGATSMLWATFGATLPPFLLVVWGAMLAASDPALGDKLATNPLAAIASLLPSWYPVPLLAFAALGLLSGAVVTMYSGGFALQALGLKLRRGLGTLISAILVLAVSAALVFVVTDFSSLVRDLIITIAVPVAAWAGIFAAEMMIRTRRFHTPSLLAQGGIYPQLRPLNFVALIIISVIGLGLVSSSIPGLQWEGFLYGIAGIGPKNVLASSDAGIFVALLLGILVPLIGGVPSIRRQERTALVD